MAEKHDCIWKEHYQVALTEWQSYITKCKQLKADLAAERKRVEVLEEALARLFTEMKKHHPNWRSQSDGVPHRLHAAIEAAKAALDDTEGR